MIKPISVEVVSYTKKVYREEDLLKQIREICEIPEEHYLNITSYDDVYPDEDGGGIDHTDPWVRGFLNDEVLQITPKNAKAAMIMTELNNDDNSDEECVSLFADLLSLAVGVENAAWTVQDGDISLRES